VLQTVVPRILLIAAIPITIHALLLWDRPLYAALLLLTLPGLAGIRLIGQGSRPACLLVLLSLVLMSLVLVFDAPLLPLYLPPVLINAALALLFGLSLLPGSTALIVRLATQMSDDTTPRMERYAYWLTAAWALVFVGLTVESWLLARYASLETWSLFINLLNYLFVALVFVVEYPIRRWVLGKLPHDGFVDFISQLSRQRFSG